MIRKITLFGGIFCALQALSLLGMSDNAHQTTTKEDHELAQWMISLPNSKPKTVTFADLQSDEQLQKSPHASCSPISHPDNASLNSTAHQQMLAQQKRLESPWASPIVPPIHPTTLPSASSSSESRSPSPEPLPNFPETYLPLREQALKNIAHLEMIRICTEAALVAQATQATVIKLKKPASKPSKRQKRVSQKIVFRDITNKKNNHQKGAPKNFAATNELRRSVRIQRQKQNKENMA